MTKPWLGLILLVLALVQMPVPFPASGSVLRVQPQQLFDQSVTRDLRWSQNRTGIELETGELYEDDGPASGHSYRQPENREAVTSQVWIKKELVIPNPEARAAYLVVLSDESFEAVINGHAVKLGQNQSGRKLHQAYAFDPKLLKPGINEIVLRKSGRVMIARSDEFAAGSRTRTNAPNRSAKSIDGGRTWDYHHLGPDGKIEGEYGVRIFLEHYRAQGTLTMPVLDAGNLAGKAVGGPVDQIGPIKVVIAGEAGTAGHLRVRARTGDTYVPGEKDWSDWEVLAVSGGVVEKPRGRYVQVAVDLSTQDRLQSPTLSGVQVEAAPACGEDWTAHVRVRDEHNETIVRTSIPFEYEPLDHPRLKQLREEYKLDEVVRGAKDELELMSRLARWACNAWDWPNHIGEYYPPWDALEILKPYKDGKPTGGFCLQFNVVFLQACESFGFPGRAISISQGRWQDKHPGGGHEIVELWSNEWKKWVYVDGALAWYVVDEKTGMPLSMWEMRRRQLQALEQKPSDPVRVVAGERTRNKQFVWNGLGGPEPLNYYLELRMIPRSNFLQEQSPLPLNQGTEEWSWTGHYVWSDAEVPAGYLFGHRVSKHSDFEWTLNQAHYVLEAGKEPGVLRVHLDTETPSFQTFLAEIDRGEKKPVAPVFNWVLHPGENRMRVRPRNVLGRDGIESWIALDYWK